MEFVSPLVIATLVFIGLNGGGLLFKLFESYIHNKILYINVFCSGLLVGLIGLDILPEALKHYDSIGVFTGISFGILFIIITDRYFHHNQKISKANAKSLIILFLGLFLHSIPTGIALGLDLQDGGESSLLKAVLIHHFPEGMILMSSVMASEKSNKTFLHLALLISLSVGLTVGLGMNSSIDFMKIHTIFTGMAIGTIGYVAIYEMIWKAMRKLSKRKVVFYLLLGIVSIKAILEMTL